MGLLDKFKKNKNAEVPQGEAINSAGWDAITETCEKVYPTQKNPMHYGTLISWQFGGNDPLKGISMTIKNR